MQVIYSYLVKNEVAENLEDDIHLQITFSDEELARKKLEDSGYVQVNDRSYEKQLNSTLYDLATLVK